MESNEDVAENDLIDFDAGSIPPSPTSSSVMDDVSDNLLDSELPMLEQKLQTTVDKPVANLNRAADVEDILITIDDDDDDGAVATGAQIGQTYLDFCLKGDDNLEALSVLMQLDEVLDRSLTDIDAEQSIEECLMELDDYLKGFDISDVDSVDGLADGRGGVNGLAGEPPDLDENEVSSIDEAVCHHQSNRASPALPNFDYVAPKPADVEDRRRNGLFKSESLHFPRTLFKIDGASLTRHLPSRATIAVAGSRPKRTVTHPPIASDDASVRISSTDGAGSIVRDNPTPTRDTVTSGSEEHDTVGSRVASREDMEVKNETARASWLRTSMRRVRHFRLPSDPAPSETDDAASTASVMEHQVVVENAARPVSAPSRLPGSSVRVRSRSTESRRSTVSRAPDGRTRSSSTSSRSRRHRSLSSSESSIASSVDSTPSCRSAPTSARNEQEQIPTTNTRRPCERQRSNDIPEAESPLGQWPHSLSSMLACLSCSLGLFNICRFALLSVHFGANFIFQFTLLSIFIGMPLFTLQMCLGQQLGAGVVDMWRISPLFQGVGVSLLISQGLIGLYSITGVSWMFVYFKDSFITKMDRYRWAEPFSYYRKEIQPPVNGTFELTETVPDYLSGIVFQRTYLVSGNVYGTIKFQPAFNLAVVWMIVFVSLSKGLRSYGKVIYVFTLIPVFGTFALCAKLLGMMPAEYVNVIFPETSWGEFFTNPKSWLAASQEVFLTWGLLGAAVMQIASHNKNRHLLQRDSSLIAVITFSVLLLMAFLANTCVQILRSYGYTYQPDSFEKLSSYTFLRHIKEPLPPSWSSTPVKYMTHNSFVIGEKVLRPGTDHRSESGYQVLRLATELVPATFSVLGSDQISPFWAVLFYFIVILFGIAQQLAIWHCVITGIMAIKAKVLKSWETTITFFSCACGFILGLPMTTELGIYVVYFLDVTVGGLWWLILVYLLQIVAVFMVRGRPYSGDTVVTALFTTSYNPCLMSWAPALLSFTWNVVLPVVLIVFCVAFFKNGNFRELFIWHHAPSVEYWPLWARQIGSMIQLLPVLCVPIVAVIQSYRYLNNGPPDILERIQLLYRPPLGEHMDDLAIQEASLAMSNTATTAELPPEDPPPKYTPPPSYTTATGARIAKLLRQSIRRSVRRLANVLGEGSGSRQRPTLNNDVRAPPPPDYNTVLVEMNQTVSNDHVSISVTDASNAGTLERQLDTAVNSSGGMTAADVANILRSSFRLSRSRAVDSIRRSVGGTSVNDASLSAENLVACAAPIGETSLVLERLSNCGGVTDNKDVSNDQSSVI